ncbi:MULTISPECIES: AAA family ATPase [unclassified Rhizobium]|uniref:AAA family ATPase n=1 Tax=unclassified Rhizobium TaxID=2613769 RepID=UPI00180EE538|nr:MULTISPECIES: AAA family ATPase [unclassified Rhizobium]MBB3394208.1 putative ATP-dependent endonuclease of OLD family [Rhizobium sp. BK060]MBB4169697.1 putative ATP-dependent endonuclease of OLD family [Rhizobium sp. BK538]
MATIRTIEIENFRGIKKLQWHPKPGVNCLIGPGDSGKSTILDAIDLCLGATRSSSTIRSASRSRLETSHLS